MREDIGVASHDRCVAQTRVTLLYPPSHTSVKPRLATELAGAVSIRSSDCHHVVTATDGEDRGRRRRATATPTVLRANTTVMKGNSTKPSLFIVY